MFMIMVLVSENTNVLEGKLKYWWEVSEQKGLKIIKAEIENFVFKFNNKGENRRVHNNSEVNLLIKWENSSV